MASKLKTKFKEDWINAAKTNLGDIDTKELADIFDKNFVDSDINIYNSVKFKNIKVPSVDYYYGALNNFILSENGRIFWNYKKKPSVFGKGIINKMAVRSIFKKEKMHLKAIGDNINANTVARKEKTTKTFINGLYGLSGFVMGYFFNIDVADSVTCGGRNVIAVASIVNELLGGEFHFYLLNAHIKLLNHVLSEDCDAINTKYTLVNATTEMCLKTLLGAYYDDYYAKTFLYDRIDKLTQNQRNVLYLKNNLVETLKVPEIRNLIEQYIIIAKENNNLIEDINGAMMINILKNPLVKDIVKKMNDSIIELCYGLYYYDGDYVEGIYRENLEYVVRNIKRKKIALMDTDSNVTVLSHERHLLLDTFKDIIGDKINDHNFTHITMVVLAGSWYISCIQHGFKLYSKHIGIDESLIPMIDLECELIMDDCQITILKKNYAFKSVLHDNTVLDEFDVRGMKYTKSDSNAKVAELVEDMVKNDIIIPIKDIDYKHLHNKIKSKVEYLKTYMKSLEFLKDSKTVLKLKDVDKLVWGEHRLKAVRLWQYLYPNIEIEVPGAFGIIKTDFTKEYLERVKTEYPHIYEVLRKYAKELLVYTMANRCKSLVGVDLHFDYNLKDQVDIIKTLIDLSKKYDMTNFDELKDRYIAAYDAIYYRDMAYAKNIIGIPKDMKIDKVICDIKKIAIPMEIAEVPEIFSIFDGMLFNDESTTELEHLIGPLMQTISTVVSKNITNNNMCCTNILMTF